MIAAVAEIGRPSASRAPIAMPVVELPAASGAARPRIAPLPNCGLLRRASSFFSRPKARKVGISDPPAGTTPNGRPIAVPRSQAGIASRNSRPESHGRPLGLMSLPPPMCRSRHAT